MAFSLWGFLGLEAPSNARESEQVYRYLIALLDLLVKARRPSSAWYKANKR